MNQRAFLLGYLDKAAYDISGNDYAALGFDPAQRGLKERLVSQVQQGLTDWGQSLASRAPSTTGVQPGAPFERPGQLAGTRTPYGPISVKNPMVANIANSWRTRLANAAGTGMAGNRNVSTNAAAFAAKRLQILQRLMQQNQAVAHS